MRFLQNLAVAMMTLGLACSCSGGNSAAGEGKATAAASDAAATADKTGSAMIKIYVMETCPDCTYVEEQIKGQQGYEIIDIGTHVKKLKEFLHIRDTSAVFDAAKANGSAGIPCFVLEDGTVTLSPEDVGLKSRPVEGESCSIDGTGC